MKKLFVTVSLLIAAALLGCGSGGGGSASNSPQSTPSTNAYLVSTVVLDTALNTPAGIAFDGLGDMYVTDPGAQLVRKITNLSSASAHVSTILGGGGTDYSFCLNSRLDTPSGIAIDSTNKIYVAEVNRTLIRYSDCETNPSVSAQYGSTGAGLALSTPSGIALRGSNLHVADTGNHLIRLIANTGGSNGTTTTLAGTSAGYVNGLTGVAAFSRPSGVAVSSSGNVFVADTNNCAIRLISSGQVTTFAGALPSVGGTGVCGSSDGTTTAARFDHPSAIAIDSSNNLYVADTASNKIRRITPSGVVTTIAGSGVQGSADGNGSNATFNAPTGITVDASGNIYVVDSGNRKIRKIRLTP
jgi:sugar lactone lactonase YvrE